MGITYNDGGLVPCFITEEKYDDDSIKAYHGDLVGFMRHLSSYRDIVDDKSENGRKLVGVFHTASKVKSEEDKLFTKWDENRFGTRHVPGFI